MASVWTMLKYATTEDQLKLVSFITAETEELTKRKFKKLLEQDFELGKIDALHTAMRDKIKENNGIISEKRAVESNTKYFFITISFDPKIKLDKIKIFHKKFITKGCFNKCLGVLEQRGTPETNDIGKGVHAHYLVERNYISYKPFTMKRNIKKSCKNFVGNVESDKFVHFKACCEEFARDKQDYILKGKYGETKDKKQEGDKIFREKNNIEEYLGKPIFT